MNASRCEWMRVDARGCAWMRTEFSRGAAKRRKRGQASAFRQALHPRFVLVLFVLQARGRPGKKEKKEVQ